MTVLIITNIILAAGIALLAVMVRENRPIVMKEAKPLHEYYEGKLKEMTEKAEKAERERKEYKGLYERELQRSGTIGNAIREKAELEAQVERLTKELSSCEDRISDMAQENANLKGQIETLKKPASKRLAKKGKE